MELVLATCGWKRGGSNDATRAKSATVGEGRLVGDATAGATMTVAAEAGRANKANGGTDGGRETGAPVKESVRGTLLGGSPVNESVRGHVPGCKEGDLEAVLGAAFTEELRWGGIATEARTPETPELTVCFAFGLAARPRDTDLDARATSARGRPGVAWRPLTSTTGPAGATIERPCCCTCVGSCACWDFGG